jgi:hypothetical protein
MGYSYADSKGWLALGPSMGGATALLKVLNKGVRPELYPQLHELLTTGETSSPNQLAGEAARLAKKIKDKDVRDTLLRMARAATIAKDYIAVTH